MRDRSNGFNRFPDAANNSGGKASSCPRFLKGIGRGQDPFLHFFLGAPDHIRTLRTSPTRRLKISVCIAFIATCVSGSGAISQMSQGGVLKSDLPGLSAVEFPDTRGLEPEVREHLAAAQDELVVAVKKHTTPADKLGEAYGMMGEIYHAYSLTAPAKICYLNATRLVPTDFRWVYLLGKLYELEGDAQRAINYYEHARRLGADYLPVLVSLGNIYLQLNGLDEAETFFRRALEIDKASAAALYGLGQAALSKRSYSAAISHIEEALRLAPQANRLHYTLAMAYRGLGSMQKAQSHLVLSGPVGVRASDPLIDGLQNLIKGARLHLIRGRAALEARRYSEAADEFRKAIAEQPNSIPAHFNLGAALTQTGELREAIQQFSETLRLDPDHANAHYNLGLLFAQANEHEEAIKHLRSTIRASPDDSSARFLLAQELVNIQRFDEAEAEFSKVVHADPDNEKALFAYVGILLAKKRFRQALAALENGHSQFPQKGLTTATLAYLLAAIPQTDLRDGKRALDLAMGVYDATDAVNHGALVAMALAELGRCDEAAAWIRRMTDKANDQERHDLVEKLKTALKRYESERPCRPAGEINISDQEPLR